MIIKDLILSRWIYPLLKNEKVTGFFAFMLIGSCLFAQSGIPELMPVTQTYVLQNVQIVVRQRVKTLLFQLMQGKLKLIPCLFTPDL